MAVLEGEDLNVKKEEYPNKGEVTSHPVEDKKGTITDHVTVKQKAIELEGVITRPGMSQVEDLVEEIESWQKNGKLLQYEGRRIMQNMVIERFSVNADVSVADGYKFVMTLVQINMVESSYREIDKPVTNEGRKQTQNQNTGKKYHRVKRGDTYWGCARKYGTTVSQLESWNPWPARVIPIGVDMRVG